MLALPSFAVGVDPDEAAQAAAGAAEATAASHMTRSRSLGALAVGKHSVLEALGASGGTLRCAN